ncbi:MAG: NAD(P)-dependent oxidoreductase [Steroidobacteraceae bacterium]
MSLRDKTLFITGASRGIGLAIGLRAARDGANVVIAAKTETPHPKLPGTIHTAAQEVEKAGGRALPIAMDLRHEEQVEAAVEKAVATFGGIDILVNNASVMYREGTMQTAAKRFDLLFDVNVRGTYLVTQQCIPHLRRAANPHVLTIAPLLMLDEPGKYAGFPAYMVSKFNMSLLTMAFAEEFAADGIAFNALWPRLAIWTAAHRAVRGDAARTRTRKPEIMADAAWHIFQQDARTFTGRFTLDDDVLRDAGVVDLTPYYFDDGNPAEMNKSLQVSHGLYTV